MKRYSTLYEWIELEGNLATIGIGFKAVLEVGEVVFIELPKIGKKVQAGQEVACLESTKAAVDIYSPLSGEIIAINEQLRTQVHTINESPEKEGWLYRLRLFDVEEFEKLESSNENANPQEEDWHYSKLTH